MLSLGLSITSQAVLQHGNYLPVAQSNLRGASSLPALLSHSRAGGAMVTDSTGKTTWAPENILLRSTLAGAVSGTPGTAPTGWSFGVSGGTMVVSDDPTYGGKRLEITVSAARQFIQQDVSVSVNFSYMFQCEIVAGSGLVIRDYIGVSGSPAGATTEYYLDGVNVVSTASVSAGAHTVALILKVAATAGTVTWRAGVGVVGGVTGSATIYAPQIARVTYQITPRAYNATTTAAYYGPRFDYDAALTALGLLLEGARTNVVLWNRDLTNAAWTASNITPVKDQTGITGVASSASKITATAGNGTILQAITLASSARFQTAYVKRVTGTGVIEMTMDNGTTWTPITVTADWTRVSIPTQTLANPTVGFRIATSGDAIAVDMVQNSNGTFATSSIWTTAAAVTRAADVPDDALYSSNPAIIQYRDVATSTRARKVVNPWSGIASEVDEWIEEIAIYPVGTPAGYLNAKLTVDGPY
jgi:hypothetical protein